MRKSHNWYAIALDSWTLGWDASAVIGLRLAKLSAGGSAAAVEAQRMVSEKIQAAMALQALAITGGLGTSVESATARSLKHYRKAVRANRRRLGA